MAAAARNDLGLAFTLVEGFEAHGAVESAHGLVRCEARACTHTAWEACDALTDALRSRQVGLRAVLVDTSMLTSCKIQCGFRYSALGGGSKFTGRGLHMFCPTVQYSCAPVCPVCVPAPPGVFLPVAGRRSQRDSVGDVFRHSSHCTHTQFSFCDSHTRSSLVLRRSNA